MSTNHPGLLLQLWMWLLNVQYSIFVVNMLCLQKDMLRRATDGLDYPDDADVRKIALKI
ncbi:MAG: hypothetical protein WCO52_05075 [bacterium]